MSKQFAFDLSLARRKSGLIQRDVAHLLDVAQGTVSDLERGLYLPSVVHICTLSLIYGRNFESLFAEVIDEARDELGGRIVTLPALVSEGKATINREATLQRLEERLAAETDAEDAA